MLIPISLLSFNTQPPEGGCPSANCRTAEHSGFQHTAARRRLDTNQKCPAHCESFNTQPPEGGCSRLKPSGCLTSVSTHSRPKAAVLSGNFKTQEEAVSTHSRPKAAGGRWRYRYGVSQVSTHSRPKAAVGKTVLAENIIRFQHTAARRRLLINCILPFSLDTSVSTHSRPKAAVTVAI